MKEVTEDVIADFHFKVCPVLAIKWENLLIIPLYSYKKLICQHFKNWIDGIINKNVNIMIGN